MAGIIVDPNLEPKTKLYRYISLSQFIALVETKTLRLSRVRSWDDTWELPLSQLPTQHDNGEIEYPMWNIGEVTYGTCWTTLSESDAMWRIYSPTREGVLIQSTVSKFQHLEIKLGLLGRVHYYDELHKLDGAWWDIRKHPPFLTEALLKRRAFEHEQEVRLVTADNTRSLSEGPDSYHSMYIPVEPGDFIESVTLDPRSDTWFFDVIDAYCKRARLRAAPVKSGLYGRDLHATTRLVRQWVRVKDLNSGT